MQSKPIMQNLITTRLAEIESANHVKIMYACESGSRAWGFPSVLPAAGRNFRFQ